MRLYNTQSRQKEKVVPLTGNRISLYTCGPTVYHFAHIGNFRTYVFEDLLKRALKYAGFEVEHVMNITDIDDKTIAGALHEKTTLAAYTEPYTQAFFEDLKTLNIERADHYPRATAFIPQMIAIIQTLLDKKVAYRGADESIYFSIAAFPSYGCLSHLKMDELKSGASQRVSSDEYEKENVADFTLWKAYDPKRDGAIFWESPFGRGRPGWHIECSAMAMSLLGESIDIHVGGVDNRFPHHENEIAQSEACSGKPFVKLWLHSEHLLVDGKKMSKSLGNFYTLRDLTDKGYSGAEIRLMLLSGHYKTQLNFTFEGLDAARATLTRIADFVHRLKSLEIDRGDPIGMEIRATRSAFKEALFDDLNLAQALAVFFAFMRSIHQRCDAKQLGQDGAVEILAFLKEIDAVLGLIPFEQELGEIPIHLLEALKKREAARKEKNWEEADKQRALIQASGYQIEDSPSGPRLKRA